MTTPKDCNTRHPTHLNRRAVDRPTALTTDRVWRTERPRQSRADRDQSCGDLGIPSDLQVAGSRECLARLLSRPRVAIVGSRHGTYYGRDVAARLSRDLAGAGITVMAGLTEGIEASSHHAVLAIGGRPLAVVPGPPDIPYPTGQKHLHAQIVRRGCVVSGTSPKQTQSRDPLLERNRLIVKLAHIVILVEATAGAAAGVTAEMALELGREVGAVPGRIVDEGAQGPNRLIRDGATPILDADDVLCLLAPLTSRQPSNRTA
jgi:DNA processing protein